MSRGMPLLSGPPPGSDANEQSCRKCDKEFNILFTRSRRCNHCGYAYCHSCTDFQALIPRRGGPADGYEPVPVCAFCIDNLTITAAGKGQLKQLPLAKLKKYANAYDIKVNGVLEKDELIETILAARDPRNGCLRPANEEYYRRNSVPSRRNNRSRGFFTRAMDAMGPDRSTNQSAQSSPHTTYQARQRTTSGPSTFPRPDLDPQRSQPRQQRPNPPPPPPPPPSNPSPHPSSYGFAYRPPPTSSPHLHAPGGSQPRGRTRAASASPAPRVPTPPPAPSLDELLEMSEEQLSHLSIHALKTVLFQNHVNVRLVVEKEELVGKVRTLLEEERGDRERHAAELEEERLADERMRRDLEEAMRRSREQSAAPTVVNTEESAASGALPNESEETENGPEDALDWDRRGDIAEESLPPPPPPKSTTSPPPPALPPKAQAMASRLERTGLCVICQDEEANIAIVDCGHLCLCRPCSELIMKGSRECPLCRTRIVTEQRLLRIFRS